MDVRKTVGKVGGSFAKGMVNEEMGRFDRSTETFKGEATQRIEKLAVQIRELGDKFERSSEASRLARSLERTADYIRFRPSSEVAEDTWEVVKKYRILWIAGGVLAGAILLRLAQKQGGQFHESDIEL